MILSQKLAKYKNITHGFTTKEDGDFRLISLGQRNAAALFCQQDLILGNQVHKDNIETVGIQDKNGLIVKTDGLLTTDKGITLGIRTADCVPILFYEPEAKIIGAAHAGWRGSLLGIAGKTVREIGKIGGDKGKIICVIGPHICEKCYSVTEERAKLFEKKYINDGCLNLTAVNFDQLLGEGVRYENIEVLPYCTFHQNENFYSYRKNGKNSGQMISQIGKI